jgi:hypothetical protein
LISKTIVDQSSSNSLIKLLDFPSNLLRELIIIEELKFLIKYSYILV